MAKQTSEVLTSNDSLDMDENEVKESSPIQDVTADVSGSAKSAEGKCTVDELQKETASDDNIEKVNFKVMYSKKKYDVSFGLDSTIGKLKDYLENVIGVPPVMQKVMIKGMAKDDQTLRQLGVSKGAKVLVVGSKIDDVLSVSAPTAQELATEHAASKEKELYSSQTIHRKVLDKGIPEDAMPGVKGVKETLPTVPLSGMLNKQGKKVRLTFKLELDQIWIGTQQRTEKISMTSIKGVISEAIKDHEEYHMMALQLGPTEASRYWVYWVPTQYVDAIKDAILGKWQDF